MLQCWEVGAAQRSGSARTVDQMTAMTSLQCGSLGGTSQSSSVKLVLPRSSVHSQVGPAGSFLTKPWKWAGIAITATLYSAQKAARGGQDPRDDGTQTPSPNQAGVRNVCRLLCSCLELGSCPNQPRRSREFEVSQAPPARHLSPRGTDTAPRIRLHHAQYDNQGNGISREALTCSQNARLHTRLKARVPGALRECVLS